VVPGVTYGDHVHPSSARLTVLRHGLVAALAAALLLPGSAVAHASAPVQASDTDVPPALAPFYDQVLAWTPCRDGLTCAWLTVPLDYADPTGPTIRLRVNRAQATGPAARRQGSLVINPGGPGEGALDFTAYLAEAVANRVATQFDIVGFDPRGVGQSAPITCMTPAQTTRWFRADGTPDTTAERVRYMSLAGAIPRGCLSMSPEMARHVGTENTIQDMDVLRQALGDDRLNYLGYSYGTFLGTKYAERFPDQVGRFVLDGAIDPSLDLMEVSRGQSRGFEVAVTRFARDCTTHRDCPYAGSTAAVLAGMNRLLARLDRRPLPTQEGPALVQSEALSAIFQAMYAPVLWPSLRRALKQAEHGDGMPLQGLANIANDRTTPNSYGSNMASAFPAISCWDSTPAPGATGLRAAATAWSRGTAVPELARAIAWGNAPCSTWYGHSPLRPGPASSTTTAPILVVGTIFDPATPYAWAQALSRQLGTATLLSYRGDGHTAYGTGSRCVDDVVDAYVLTGTPPPQGTVCR
jgi:pimeloyl-ACP methyl ester carboxylesterase